MGPGFPEMAWMGHFSATSSHPAACPHTSASLPTEQGPQQLVKTVGELGGSWVLAQPCGTGIEGTIPVLNLPLPPAARQGCYSPMSRKKLRHGDVELTHPNKGERLTASLPSTGQVQGGLGVDGGARLSQLRMQHQPGSLQLSPWGTVHQGLSQSLLSLPTSKSR